MPSVTTKEATGLIQINDGEAWTTSLIIAEEFGRRHNDVMREIESLSNDGTINVRDFSHITFRDTRNRSQRAYLLSKRAALIAMPFIGGRKSRDGQKRLVDAFLTIERILKQQESYRHTHEWLEARNSGKVIRLTTTDVIQDFVAYAETQGSTSAKKYYMQLTKMEYRALFMIDRAVGEGFRDQLNTVQLLNLATAESVAQRAIREGMLNKMYYKDIYQQARIAVEKLAVLVGPSLPGDPLSAIAA